MFLSMEAALAITNRVLAPGHVMRGGVLIDRNIAVYTLSEGVETIVTSEGMVVAQRPTGRRLSLQRIDDAAR
jgi:hypothetical protein